MHSHIGCGAAAQALSASYLCNAMAAHARGPIWLGVLPPSLTLHRRRQQLLPPQLRLLPRQQSWALDEPMSLPGSILGALQ